MAKNAEGVDPVGATDSARGTSRIGRGFLHYLAASVSTVFLVGALALAALVIIVPATVGGSALTVLTSSMEPGLPPGTLIVIRPVAVDAIHVGEVVTYQVRSDEPEVVSHRVVSRSTDSSGRTTFITRGDNNSLPDADPVTAPQIRGVLWYAIPWIGFANNLVGGGGRAVLVPLVAVALFAYAAWVLIAPRVRAGSRPRREFEGGVGTPSEADPPTGDIRQ